MILSASAVAVRLLHCGARTALIAGLVALAAEAAALLLAPARSGLS